MHRAIWFSRTTHWRYITALRARGARHCRAASLTSRDRCDGVARDATTPLFRSRRRSRRCLWVIQRKKYEAIKQRADLAAPFRARAASRRPSGECWQSQAPYGTLVFRLNLVARLPRSAIAASEHRGWRSRSSTVGHAALGKIPISRAGNAGGHVAHWYGEAKHASSGDHYVTRCAVLCVRCDQARSLATVNVRQRGERAT